MEIPENLREEKYLPFHTNLSYKTDCLVWVRFNCLDLFKLLFIHLILLFRLHLIDYFGFSRPTLYTMSGAGRNRRPGGKRSSTSFARRASTSSGPPNPRLTKYRLSGAGWGRDNRRQLFTGATLGWPSQFLEARSITITGKSLFTTMRKRRRVNHCELSFLSFNKKSVHSTKGKPPFGLIGYSTNGVADMHPSSISGE